VLGGADYEWPEASCSSGCCGVAAASKKTECLGELGSGFGGPDHEHLPGVGGEVHAVVGEGEVADDGVVKVLGAGVVEADVVGGPAGAELGALSRELADEVGEAAVVGIAPGC
jgi:hypothetical protein